MPNIQELTEERLNQLDRLLLEWAVEEENEETEGDYWEVSTLDGYFTALILGPRIAPSSEWLPPILNTLTFESAEEFDLMFGLLMSLHHYRALQWAENPEDFEPLGLVLEGPDEWCRGFMLGVALQHHEWQPLYAKKEHAAWLFNIQALTDPELRKHLQSDFRERWLELREQWIATVPVAVVQLYRFWRAREHKGEPTPTSSRLKVGRNDPCPCGSGQKFKKCCGNRPPVLH